MNLRPYTRLNSQNPPYPREAVFQKLQRSQTQSSQNKTDLIFSHFWVEIPGFRSLDYNLQPIDQFPGKWYPILDINSLIYIPYPRVNCLKTIPFTAAHTYIAHIWQYPPPPPGAFILLNPSHDGLALYSASNQENCDSVLSRTSVLTLAYLRNCGVEKLFALSIFLRRAEEYRRGQRIAFSTYLSWMAWN